jgi:hypothetical protein
MTEDLKPRPLIVGPHGSPPRWRVLAGDKLLQGCDTMEEAVTWIEQQRATVSGVIEPGDLIRWGDGDVAVALLPRAAEPWTLIAKGPGWTRHDGSSFNPVPGAICRVYALNILSHYQAPSVSWAWDAVQFYRVTREAPSQPPAPQPGWVATVTLKWVGKEDPNDPRSMIEVKWPDGSFDLYSASTLASLDWQPPPPPPWEPEVGKRAYCSTYECDVIVKAMDYMEAWVHVDEKVGNDTVWLSDLSPPKGGEA